MRVLVADDSRELRFLVRTLLEDAGMEVEEASSGQVALDRLDRSPPVGAVVLDQRMPDMSGLDVAAALTDRGQAPRPPLILFSSYLRPPEQAEADRLAVRVVPKADLTGLVDALRACGPRCPA